MERQIWLDQRRRGIGGTDIAAICGVHPYSSPAAVWSDKMGLTEVQENEPMHWGKRLEKVVGDEYAEREGCDIVHLSDQIISRERNGVLLQGSPDAMVFPPGKVQNSDLGDVELICRTADKGLEIKTASAWAKGWGTGAADIPPHYYIQCQWYMMLTGKRDWDLAVLIGGMDFRVYRLKAHPRLQEILALKAVEFWNDHIEARVMPDADASEHYRKAAEAQLPRKTEAIAAEVEDTELADALFIAKNVLEQKEHEVKQLQNKLLERMVQKGATAILGDNWKASSITMSGRKTTDWKTLQKDLNISADTIEKYSKLGQDYRVFRFDMKGIE